MLPASNWTYQDTRVGERERGDTYILYTYTKYILNICSELCTVHSDRHKQTTRPRNKMISKMITVLLHGLFETSMCACVHTEHQQSHQSYVHIHTHMHNHFSTYECTNLCTHISMPTCTYTNSQHAWVWWVHTTHSPWSRCHCTEQHSTAQETTITSQDIIVTWRKYNVTT